MAHSKRLISALVTGLVTTAALLVPVSPAAAHTSYVVQAGDTLSGIAQRHGISTADLAAENGITNLNLIRIGQTLSVPTPEPTYYTVQAGDSLSQIAAANGVPTADLAALNGIGDPNHIRVGQQLQLPAETVAAPTSSIDAVAARYSSLPESITANPDRLALIPSFERWAAHYGVPADLVMAVAYQESGWQASVVSSAGAIGVGQLLPTTADWVAADLIGVADLDPYNTDDNIRMSTRFLLWLIGYLGSESEAIAGYYQGPTSLTIKGLYDETQAYVANVEGIRWRFQQG
ncbi:MAG: LysM peptidoglycan-binding domain-containing protein [Acidimicrobiia bacterium]|nr:LysM peptidoglycan-binding domain-containing protein [Acidimicrobiia bacterium]